MSCLSVRCSGMTRVNEGSYSSTWHPRLCTSVMNHTCLNSSRTSPHFGWYSFPVPLRVGDWVGLGDLVKYRGGLSLIPLVVAAGNWAQYHGVTSPTVSFKYSNHPGVWRVICLCFSYLFTKWCKCWLATQCKEVKWFNCRPLPLKPAA